jgi:hypothetical protein
MVGVFDHLLPILRLICGVLWVGRTLHTLVTCIAEPESDPQRVGTWPNSDLMEDKMSRGEEENELTLEWNLVFYLNSIFCNSFRDGVWDLFSLFIIIF